MKKIFLGISFFTVATLISSLSAAGSEDQDWSFGVSSGYAWTKKIGLSNPDTTFWDASTKGYDDKLSTASFVSFSAGRNIFNHLAGAVEYSLYQTLNYQKHQTGTGSTGGFTGDERMRFFDITHQSVLFNFKFLVPNSWNLSVGNCMVYPVLGAGIGLGISKMSNFHTVGYAGLAALGNTTSIGFPNVNTSLAWQVNSGLEFKLEDSAGSMGIGYRYYDGGNFESGTSFMLNTAGIGEGGALSEHVAWKAKLKMHQVRLCLGWDF